MRYLALLALFLCSIGQANDLSEWHLVEMDKTYIDYMHFTYAAEPFFQPYYTPTTRLDLHVDLKLLDDAMFFNNMVHTETDQTQFRSVGWNYRLGVHLGDSVDLYFEHYSIHLLDAIPQFDYKYDAIGVRIYLYKGSK